MSAKETEITEKEDWIRRLLEYTELSQEELKMLLEKEKATADIMDELSKMQLSSAASAFFDGSSEKNPKQLWSV